MLNSTLQINQLVIDPMITSLSSSRKRRGFGSKAVDL